MKYKVTRKQDVSHNCFICGEDNPSGLKMAFYETENKEVVGFFKGDAFHVSYPDRLHGGVIAAILDETIGRAIEIYYPKLLGVTLSLSVRYRKPVPPGAELKCVGRINKDTGIGFAGSGEILGPGGEVFVTAEGTYKKIDPDKQGLIGSSFKDDKMFSSRISEEKEYVEY